MKQNPGEWLRSQILDRNLEVALWTTAGTVWLGGAVLGLWVGSGSKPLGQWFGLIAALLPGAAFLGKALYVEKSGWRVPDMRKGARAEETIGQAIEYALTRDTCAVAHHVEDEDIARIGDIDHLVVTPDGLWVIETKHGRVPKSEFAETLRRIAANVEGVREWAPGVRVTGCLVFANKQRRRPKPAYKHGKETIRAFADGTALKGELSKKARETGDSRRLARRVWELGKLEAAD